MGGRNVVIVTDWYPSPERPVLGTFILQQAKAVATRHEVAVIVSPASGSPLMRPYEISDREEFGLRTLRVRHAHTRVPRLGFAFRLAGALAAVRRLRASGFRADVVHAHIYGPGLVGLVLARVHRVPVVVSEQFSGIALGTVGGTDRAIARFVYGRADLVCPASEDLGTRIAGYAADAKVRVVPNAVDSEVFHPREERPDGTVRALYVGALQDTKGIPELLDAVAALRDRHRLRVDLVGDGPARSAYERRARELGLEETIEFVGALPHPNVAEEMRAASFLVHPSHWENLPNVLIEALACGLPVVATNVGGTPEIVRPHEGILVPPLDVPALAGAIDEMCARFEEFDSERLSREAHARFGIDAVAERWTQVYEDVIAARGGDG